MVQPDERDPVLTGDINPPDPEPYHPIYNPFSTKPVIIRQRNDFDESLLLSTPILGALLFDNAASDARDHCANERTFLSWLRLSIYMAIVSVAIAVSFHLKHEPSEIERKLAVPFGVIFWLLSIACLVSGVANYFRTVANYSRRAALVQSGWKTEVVFTVVAVAIVGACILFLSVDAGN